MQTVMGILSLAVSVASLAALFTTKEKRTRAVVGYGLGMFLALVATYLLVERITHWNHVSEAENAIVSLFNYNNPMTFEDVRLKLDGYDPSILQEAMARARKGPWVRDAVLTLTSDAGNKYQVRVFNSVNFPIR